MVKKKSILDVHHQFICDIDHLNKFLKTLYPNLYIKHITQRY